MSKQPPALVPAGSAEIMDYMDGKWCSTYTWQALFDQFTRSEPAYLTDPLAAG